MSRTSCVARALPPPRRTASRWKAARTRQADERVAPDRCAVRAQTLLGPGERIDGGVILPGVPLGEASGVRGPRRFPGIADPDREPRRRVGRGLGAEIVTGVREQVRELPL